MTTHTFFHGTSTQRLDSILQNGLDPAFCLCADDEAEYFDDNTQVLFVDDRKSVAEYFAKDCVLRIELTDEQVSALITDRGEYIRVPFIIPACQITVCN
jgi:hypothetical protein